jgi:uncharacterized phiE125 gp8 family phage protein
MSEPLVTYRLVTPATEEPLAVGDLSAWLRDPPDEDNADIEALITSARKITEQYNGQQLAIEKWSATLDEFPSGAINLLEPLAVVAPATSSIVSFTYKDCAGTVHTMTEGTHFIVDSASRPGRVLPPYGCSWPSDVLWPGNAITVQFTAGLAPASVPETLKQFMRALVTGWYEKRVPFEPGEQSLAMHPFILSLAMGDALIRF